MSPTTAIIKDHEWDGVERRRARRKLVSETVLLSLPGRSHAGNAQEGQGGIATAHARTYPRARGLAQASGRRLLRLPCRADQRPCTESILLLCDANLVAHAAAARPEGPLLMATNAKASRRLAPPTAYPSPVS